MKTKSKILILTSLIATSNGAYAAQGGISGGGGGSLPADPASAQSIRTEIKKSRLELYFFFNKLNVDSDWQNSGWMQESLFSGTRTIWDALKTTKILINETGPCLADNGSEWDGYAPGPEPDSICISLKRLTGKLSTDDYRAQVLGLIAHEMSHMTGANEDQAKEIQKKAVQVFKKNSNDDFSNLFYIKLQLLYFDKTFLEDALLNNEWQNEKRFCEELESLIKYRRGSLANPHYTQKDALSIFNFDQMRRYHGVSAKAETLFYFSCIQTKKSDTFWEIEYWDKFESLFKDSSEVTLPQAEEILIEKPARGPNPTGYILRKPVSDEIVKQELEEMYQVVQEENDLVNSLIKLNDIDSKN